MADDNKWQIIPLCFSTTDYMHSSTPYHPHVLREEETCKTDKSALLYTMSAVLHIQILLHAAQPEPAEPFLAAHLEPFLAAQPEPSLAAQPEPFPAAQPEPAETFLAVQSRTRNPRPPRAMQSNPKPRSLLLAPRNPEPETFLAPCHPERSRL